MSALRNLAFLGLSRLSWRAAAAVTGILAARHLGVAQHGSYATALAWVTVVGSLADPGASTVVLRTVSRGRSDESTLVGNALLLSSASALLLGTSLVFATALLDPALLLPVLLLGVGAFLEAALQPVQAWFQGREQMHLTGFLQAFTPVVGAAGAAAVVITDGGLLGFVSARAAAGLFLLPVAGGLLLRHLRPRAKLGQLGGTFRAGAPFALGNGLSFAMAHGPTLAASWALGTSEAGLYAAGHRPVGMLWVLPSIASSVLIPRLFRSAHDDPEEHARAVADMLRGLLLLGLVGASALVLSSEVLVELLYGESYAASATVTRGLAVYYVLQCACFALGDALTTRDRHRWRLLAMAAGAVVSVVGTALLASRLGLVGGCVAATASELTMLLVMVLAGRETLAKAPVLSLVLRAAGAAALGWLAVSGAGWGPVAESWPEAVGAGALWMAVFVVVAAATGLLRRPEVRISA